MLPNEGKDTPLPRFALLTKEHIEYEKNLREHAIDVSKLTKDDIVANLLLEARDRRCKNQAARIKALELVAKLRGYLVDKSVDPNQEEDEPDKELTSKEAEMIVKAFNENY